MFPFVTHELAVETSDRNEGTEQDFELLSKFFSLENNKIKSVAEAFNRYGTDVSYIKFAQITGLKIGTDALNTRYALASLVNSYSEDKRIVEKYSSKINYSELQIKKLKFFLESLTKKGIESLELLYESEMAEEYPSIYGVGHRLLLTMLPREGKGKIYVPLIRLTIDANISEEEERSQSFFIPLDNFNALIESLKKIQSDANREAKSHQKRLGNSLIYGGMS
jgi:hypothetical protein